MVVCLIIGFLLTLLAAIGVIVTGKGALHEIEGLILLLTQK